MNCNCKLPMLGGMSATGRSLGHFSLNHIPQQISTLTKRLHLNRNLNDDNLIEIMGGLLGNAPGSNPGEGGNLVEMIAGAVLGNTGNSEEGGNNGEGVNGGLVEIINKVLGNLEGGNAGLGEVISSIVSNNTGETGPNYQEIIEAVISWFQDVVNNIDLESIFGSGFALPTDVELMQILTEYLNNIDTQTLVEMMGGMEMQLQCQCTPA